MVSRRRFLQMTGASVAMGSYGGLAASAAVAPGAAGPGEAMPTPSAGQQAWQDAEVGILYCFDLPVAASVFAPNNAVRERLDPARYNPTQLDTDAWLAAAKAAGAGYAVFTATHFSGFMQWQSDLYPYGMKQAKWRDGKGDVVGDFVESCRRMGIKPGIYFSTHRNAWQTVWGHYVDWGRGRGTDRQKAFNHLAERMTEELCKRYGELAELWFDAGVKTPAEGGPDVLPVFNKYQPQGVFYHSSQRCDHRWIGNEAGHAGEPCWATMPGDVHSKVWKQAAYHGDPNGPVWSPGMVDIPLRGGHGVHAWFWRPGQDKGVYTTEQLLGIYHRSVGRNANLIVGLVIEPDGSVPEADAVALTQFGREIRSRYDRPLAKTTGRGDVLELILPAPARIDRLVAMEDIAHGERIRKYAVAGLAPGGDWETICQGASVGHKRIHAFPPTEVAAVRLTVLESRATPQVRKLAVYGA